MTTLENRLIAGTATDADIRHIAQERFAATKAIDSTGRNYLRAVVAATVVALDAKPRVNFGSKVPKLKPDEQTTQLTALQTVHDRYYAIVVEVCSDHLPPGKAKALELNRRTNYARTAFRAARNWIRAGNDLTAVPPSRITKKSLDVAPRVRPPSPRRLKTRVEARSKALIASIIELANHDKAGAIGELELVMGQCAQQLAELIPGGATRDPRQAMREHRPLRAKGGSLFMPVTETQVIRQQARPS